MILEALRAELLKMTRNRWSTFWAYGFPPLFTLLAGLLVQVVVRLPADAGMFNAAAPISSVRDGLATYSGLFLQLFPIAGAAILFAGEYRWETWRAILTRNGRTSIMLAKLIAFVIAIVLSILACGLAGLIIGVVDASQAASVIWPRADSGTIALSLAMSFGGAFLQLMSTAGLVMVLAVFSRAIIAAIVGPFLILSVAEIGSLRFRLPDLRDWAPLFPNMANDSIQQVAHNMLDNSGQTMSDLARSAFAQADAYAQKIAAPGAAALVMWAVVFAAAAIFIFRGQDLSKE
jgi:ABC-2 type transport system permease protein